MVVLKNPLVSDKALLNKKPLAVVKPIGKTIGNTTPPSPTPNADELKATETTGIQRIMNDPLLSAGQKKSRVRDLLNITRGGEDKPADGGGGIFGAVKSVGKVALGGLAKATQVPVLKQTFEGLGYYGRFVQALAQDTTQVGFRYALGPLIAGEQAIGISKSHIDDLKQQQKWLNENRPTFGRFAEHVMNKEYALFGTDPVNNFVSTGRDGIIGDAGLNFGVQAYIDPLSRVGVGAKANMGYGGRAGLVADMSTAEMIAKYPVLAEAGVADKILRIGAAGIPKVVRQGEGINLGLRYAGVILPRTEALEIGFANSFGRARAAIGDVVYSTAIKKLPVVGQAAWAIGKVTTPKSLAGLRTAGGGRRGLLGIEAIQEQMVEFSANRFAKGEFATASAKFNMDLIPLIKRQRELVGVGLKNRIKGIAPVIRDKEARNLYRYVEMSEADLVLQPITEELKQLARDTKIWQNNVRESVNQMYVKFGEDFSVNVREIGFIDDYIFHKMDKVAKEWMRSELGGVKAIKDGTLFKSADLAVKDLVDPTGPMMFRKLRAPYTDPDTGVRVVAEFLGVPLETAEMATIDGLNAISRSKLGFNWFDTDFASIAESYSFSMAKARSRQAFARRAMDYGENFIKPLLPTMIPDSGLVVKMEEALSLVTGIQSKLRNRISVNKQLTKDYVKSTTDSARRFLSGEYKRKALTTAEIGSLYRKLDELTFKLTEANRVAGTMTATARGEFATVHSIMLDEVTNLRAALDNPDRYAAVQELRAIYTKMYPNHNPNLIDLKSPEWLAEKILNGRGIPAAREIRSINAQMKKLRETIDATPEGAEYDAVRANLESDYYDLETAERSFSILADVRAEATYASDGLVYGSAEDLIPLPAEAGDFKIFRTKPVDDAFDSSTSSVAMHAPTTIRTETGPSNVIDLREGPAFSGFFRHDGIIEGIADGLERRGILEEANQMRQAAQHLNDTGSLGPFASLDQTMPEVAELVRTVHNHGVSAGYEMTEDAILDALTDVDDVLRLFGQSLDEASEEIDVFAREIMDNALGHYAKNNMQLGEAGLVVPQRWIDEGVEGLEGEFAILMPNEFTIPSAQRVPTTNSAARVQQVAGNKFVADIRSGAHEQASLDASLAKSLKEEEIIQLENSQIVSAEARAEIKKLAGQKGGLTRAQNARAVQAEKAREQLMLTNSVDIELNGVKQTLTREQAQKALTSRQVKLENAYVQLDKRIDAIYVRNGVPRSGSKGGAGADAVTDYRNRIAMLMDDAKVLKTWSSTTAQVLKRDIDDMRVLLSSLPRDSATAGEASAWVRRVDATLNSMGGIQDPAVRSAYERVTTLLHADEAQLARLEAVALPAVEMALKDAKSGWLGRMVETTEKGWEEIAGLGVQMPEELLAHWKPNLARMKKPEGVQEFYEAYKITTSFFKVYATSTVGFFTRNGISATFANIVDGVKVKNIADGFDAARAIGKGADGSGHWWQHKNWEEFLASKGAERELYETAWKATETSGRGIADDFGGLRVSQTRTQKLTNNPYTRAFQQKNEFVERAVRMPMALDSLRKGKTFDQTVSRLVRNHFDYSDLSPLDEAAKKVIPFWIWTSRNVPLQVVQQWANPAAYSVYNKFAEANPVSGDVLMPKWIADWNPLALGGPNGEGGQWVATPDLPNVRLEQQVKQIGTVKGLLGQLSPIMKVPLEFVAGKQLGIDVGPFQDLKQTTEGAVGLDKYLLAPLAQVMGGDAWVKTNAKGETILDPRVAYAFQNAMPALAQLNRVTGGQTGGKSSYGERQLGNIANWFGIPIRYVGPQQQESEAVNRQFEVAAMFQDLVNSGQILSSKDLKAFLKYVQANPQGLTTP
ncbi:hypothetical protein UFOVP1353_18 [uncultured Caudovirales phage]|uniref:Large polyvalent protein associated domain-containing protein n=3 Tax=uncultured Caudovirales phage TaxID=2100421 RepID=A0A6J5SIW4_9CAUD|nr:hypothetical protein UFOVP578_27 [uncultured Caudovirales phage]CAB4183866.1 hypothetical protein UFOVP1098_15 [uncultured Caudovirales phage]CAB4200038.1 hypothetical protein UFOVP1353_18 [uncultured Caudovirales phage]CAB4214338.1 hypothetical protein UFOVP1458_30 [uncultured Caudovirales phage]CAB5228709.1 hypothetical protein UFOVP1546_38 [uncultured Caudovirales phage]